MKTSALALVKSTRKCYMCDEIATSVEHVPPQCLFPEQKDIEIELRKNLLTVPSCDVHNQKKSSDDEFLMVCLAGIIGNNSIGYKHYRGKVSRALKRNSSRLLHKIYAKGKQVEIKRDNSFFSLIIFTPDYERLERCFRNIAYGIYRWHFKENFNGFIKPQLSFLRTLNENSRQFKEYASHLAEVELREKQVFGENRKVFWYQVTEPNEHGIILVKLMFYENVEVLVSYMPAGTELPFNLGIYLMNQGISTEIELEGKHYYFNRLEQQRK